MKTKQVFPRETVAHLWAHKAQDSARDPSKNFWFTGAALFSYGEHFVIAAHLEDGRVLWNDSSYSVTTSKMKGITRWSMTSQQRDESLNVPGLTYAQFKNLQRLRENGTGKVLPDLAEKCASDVIDLVASMAKMRPTAEKIARTFNAARVLEKTGLELCAYVKKGRSTPKWPLPSLPDILPTGEALQELIKNIARGRLLTQYAGAMAEWERLAKIMRDEITSPYDVMNYRIQNYAGTLSTMGHRLSEAEKHYKTVHGKTSAAINKARKEQKQFDLIIVPILARFAADKARHELMQEVRRMHSALHAKKIINKKGNGNVFEYFANKLRDNMQALPACESMQFEAMRQRARRIADWSTAENLIDRAADKLQYVAEERTADKLRTYAEINRQCIAAADYAAQYPAFITLHGAKLAEMRATAVIETENLKATLLAEHAETLRAWITGESNTRPPYELGTFARIAGKQVETTRGATVPIEHACKLARMYAVTVRRGGMIWRDGAGPMIGHYRVNKIGDDGSLVIGCHEFTPSEAQRLQRVLEQCTACAEKV